MRFDRRALHARPPRAQQGCRGLARGAPATFAKLGEARWPEAKLLQLPAYAKPIQAYDGVVQVKLPLSAHASLQAMSHRLPFVLHYQLCTVRGCEVPETTVARVVVSIQPKP